MLRERAGRTAVFSGWEAVRTDQSPGVYEPRGRPPEPSGAMVWGWRWDPKIPSLDGWARGDLQVPAKSPFCVLGVYHAHSRQESGVLTPLTAGETEAGAR